MSNLESNVIIESTMLGVEHGTLTYMLGTMADNIAQGAGGVRLEYSGCAGYILGLLRTVGVSKWEDLKGQHVRVRRESPRGNITAIGHIIEDRWFDIVQE